MRWSCHFVLLAAAAAAAAVILICGLSPLSSQLFNLSDTPKEERKSLLSSALKPSVAQGRITKPKHSAFHPSPLRPKAAKLTADTRSHGKPSALQPLGHHSATSPDQSSPVNSAPDPGPSAAQPHPSPFESSGAGDAQDLQPVNANPGPLASSARSTQLATSAPPAPPTTSAPSAPPTPLSASDPRPQAKPRTAGVEDSSAATARGIEAKTNAAVQAPSTPSALRPQPLAGEPSPAEGLIPIQTVAAHLSQASASTLQSISVESRTTSLLNLHPPTLSSEGSQNQAAKDSGMAKEYSEDGDWSSLWWFPKADYPSPGKQVVVKSDPDNQEFIEHLMFLPEGDPPQEGWPLIVFLHGQGESSPTPLEKIALQGPPQQAGRHPNKLKFAVFSPQKPARSQFFDEDIASRIVGTMTYLVKKFKLDAQRIYLTGLSQGGIGAWGLASNQKYVKLFAAVAPVCGGLRVDRMAEAAEILADTPIWAFHGENDIILPVDMSDDSISAVNKVTRSQFILGSQSLILGR